jgi:hypothetical protein
MVGAALVTVLPPRTVYFGSSGVASNLLYLFALSGAMRAIFAVLLARRVREFRKPRRALAAHEFVMRVIGLNTMLELIYELTRATPEERDDSKQAAVRKSAADTDFN